MEHDNKSLIHFEKDKYLVPFLLIYPNIVFVGKEVVGTSVFFKFSPIDKVQEAINAYFNRNAPSVQPKDLLDSVERFRNEVFLSLKYSVGKRI